MIMSKKKYKRRSVGSDTKGMEYDKVYHIDIEPNENLWLEVIREGPAKIRIRAMVGIIQITPIVYNSVIMEVLPIGTKY